MPCHMDVMVNYAGIDYTYTAKDSYGWGGNGDGVGITRVDELN